MVYGGFRYDDMGNVEKIPVQPAQKEPAHRPLGRVTDLDLTQAGRIDALSRAESEIGHRQADEILCEILEQEGYYLTVRAFRAMTKWYA